jgi:curved DNA-binding protein CbpA
MPSGTRTRDWATYDYYAVLGIERTADADEVTRAFRELAKQLHPDATDDAEATERFNDVRAAYEVLGDGDLRRTYDEVRAQSGQGPERGILFPVRAPKAKPVRKPWSARKSLTVLIIGVLVALLGVGAGWLTWSMHEHDARIRARDVPVVATRGDTESGAVVSFLTKDGVRYRVPEPRQHGDPNGHGLTVNIRYDPTNPEHVIVDGGTFGRDITFAIVTLKLLVGGLVLAGFGYRRLRAAR